MLLTVFIVAILAIVQSLFGVGLLVFGTPTLLLLGHSFAGALAILLPASMTISVLQVWKSGGQDAAFIRVFAGWCLVPMAASLAAILLLDLRASLNLAVAMLLVVFVVLRSDRALDAWAREWVGRHDRVWLLVMGLVHGASNLGGALLLVFAATRSRRKEDIRAVIAVCYACFAAVQLTVLAVVTPDVFSRSQVGYATVAAIVFLLVGQRMFRWVSAPAFDSLLTLVAGAYAGLLGLRAAGVF